MRVSYDAVRWLLSAFEKGFAGSMTENNEGPVVRLIRFLALGVPALSRVLAVAFVVAALAFAFLEVGGYDAGARADLALAFAVLALVSLGMGYVVPRLVRVLLPRRR